MQEKAKFVRGREPTARSEVYDCDPVHEVGRRSRIHTYPHANA